MTKKDWLIIFFSFLGTMMGVTGAFILDNWKESNRTNSMKEVALKNIKSEIEDNLEEVSSHKDNLDSLEHVFRRFATLRNSEGQLITTPEQLARFQNEFPNFLTKEDSIPVENGKYNYSSSTKINLNLLSPKSISWDTTKELDILQEFSYECLYELEEVYSLQKVMMVEFEKILETLQSDNSEKLLNHISVLIQLESQIIPQYEELLSNIEICK